MSVGAFHVYCLMTLFAEVSRVATGPASRLARMRRELTYYRSTETQTHTLQVK